MRRLFCLGDKTDILPLCGTVLPVMFQSRGNIT